VQQSERDGGEFSVEAVASKGNSMRNLGRNVSRLAALSRAFQQSTSGETGSRLGEMKGFGSNPGDLAARTYVPDGLPANSPLVVILHGCTQTAAVYDKGSGWSDLADRHGFALLYPEQRRSNNPNLCFNWYVPGDARRGKGEAKSISQMIAKMISNHKLDASRVFVTGLSAGGAMTSVMLAAYPELFAGGAIVAGLPFATANTLPEALERMTGNGFQPRDELVERARAAAPRPSHIPTLSVWHGTRDHIVDASNADAIVDQWRGLHGLGEARGEVDMVDGHRRETWRDGKGRAVIEKYDIDGMGHGIPLDTAADAPCGTAGPHMLEANICSTSRIAESWNLMARRKGAAPRRAKPANDVVQANAPEHGGVGAIIENALRAAGLMR
jgi:poly(hydroxyalkanoate) depolymerase family esterase